MKKDKDAIMFSLSAGGAVMFAHYMNNHALAEAVLAGAFTTCTVSAGVYGLALAGRADVLTTAMQFGALVPWGARAVTAPAIAAGGQMVRPQFVKARPDVTRVDRWRVALWQFMSAGRLAGSFSLRQLAEDQLDDSGKVIRRKFVTDYGYRQFVSVLVEQEGILVAKRTGTELADGLTHTQAVARIRHLVDFPKGDPPVVMW